MLYSYDPDSEELIDMENAPYAIRTLIQTFSYKLISAYFTKACISYAVLNYKTGYRPLPQIPIRESNYTHLDNLLNLLGSCTIMVNYELGRQWGNYVTAPQSNSSYVVSGGNIFIALAGVLCYIKSPRQNETCVMLNMIMDTLNAHLTENDMYDDFYELLNSEELFNSETFDSNVKNILSNLSDIDFLFLSKHDNYVTHTSKDETNIASEINTLSASVLRQMLSDAHTTDDNKYMFPFIGQYNSAIWGNGKMFNQSGISTTDITRIDQIGQMKNYSGYRQTSSYINELPIYLNRIKQGYYPFNKNDDPSSLGHACLHDESQKYAYQTKYGECIDLSIGSTTNELYKMKHDHYMEGKYYTLDNVRSELKYIMDHSNDDKSDKRKIRLDFIDSLINTRHSSTFNYLLLTIFEHIHTQNGNVYGYPCPTYDTPEEQIMRDKSNSGSNLNNNSI